MKPAKIVLLLPMAVYVCLAVAWHAARINSITGDEPHYLLIADSLMRDADLKVVNNYQIDTPVLREFPPGYLTDTNHSKNGYFLIKTSPRRTMRIYLTDTNHSQNGYSIHGIGLPLLLVPAYYLGGV